jgi:hypothetical protein
VASTLPIVPKDTVTLRIVGGCFIALAGYIAYESGSTLIGRSSNASSSRVR